MGMFDYLTCKYPLPLKEAQDLTFQTKDTPAQFMDSYEIREDGTLWRKDYDIVDKSDKALGIGTDQFIGCLSRENPRWEQVPDFTGELTFGHYNIETKVSHRFSAYFESGRLVRLNQLEPKPELPKQSRHLYVCISEIICDYSDSYETWFHCLVDLKPDDDPEKITELLAETWYEDETPEREDNVWLFHDGDKQIRVDSWKEIPEAHYQVLQQYLHSKFTTAELEIKKLNQVTEE